MTHKELVDVGYRWVMKRCGFAFKELVTVNKEIPDVIGFNSCGTFLLEAKTSRADFLCDKKKEFRQNPEKGMGDWRFFIVPKGLVTIEELPKGWGLIEVSDSGKAFTSYNPFGGGNIYYRWERNQKNLQAEVNMMYSALRRLELRNRIKEIYNNEK